MVKKKKIKQYKSKEERSNEVKTLITELNKFGLSPSFPNIKEFYKICKEYVNEGGSYSGKLKLLGLKRVLEYNLVKAKHLNCTLNLKYNKSV